MTTTSEERRTAAQQRWNQRHEAMGTKIAEKKKELQDLLARHRKDLMPIEAGKQRRQKETREKVVLGGAVIAALRNGRLDLDWLMKAIEPGLRPKDLKVIHGLFWGNS